MASAARPPQQHGVIRILWTLPLSCDPRAARVLAVEPSSFQVYRDRTDTHPARTNRSTRASTRCTTCTPTGARPSTTPRTRAATRTSAPPSRPRSTCGTTAASVPTTTSLPRMTATDPTSPGTLRLAVIPGDGIGPEVTAEALKVLEVAAPTGVKV